MDAILMMVDGQWLVHGAFRPIRFWPYETSVRGRVLEMSFKNGDSIDLMRLDLVRVFNAARVNASVDNKTVFEVDDSLGRRWCLGFYDLRFTLGTSCLRTW